MNVFRFAILGFFLIATILFASEGALANSSDGMRETTLRWESIEGALAYEIQIRKVGVTEALAFDGAGSKLETPWLKTRLLPGRYELRLRALDRRRVPGPWSDFEGFEVKPMVVELSSPKAGEMVASNAQEKAAVRFEWKGSPGVESYALEVKDEKGALVASSSGPETEFSAELPVAAKYRWRVRAMAAGGVSGDEASGDRVFVLVGGTLPKPVITFREGEPSRGVDWQLPPRAESLETKVTIRSVATGRIKILQHLTKTVERGMNFDSKWFPGRIRVGARASAKWRQPSEWAYAEIDYKMSSVVADVQKRERGRVLGGIAPMVLSYGIEGPNIQSFSFMSSMSSSYFASGQWWPGSGPRRFGVDGWWHRARTTLFATSSNGASEVSSDQEPVDVAIGEIGAGARWRLWERRGALDLKLGGARREAMTFYAKSPTAIAGNQNSVTELMAGVYFARDLVFGVSLIGDLDLGTVMDATGMELSSASHYRANVGLSRHMFFLPMILFGGQYQIDITRYEFTDRTHALEGTMDATYHRVTGFLGYIF